MFHNSYFNECKRHKDRAGITGKIGLTRANYKIIPQSWFNSNSSMMFHTLFRNPYIQKTDNYIHSIMDYGSKLYNKKYYKTLNNNLSDSYHEVVDRGYQIFSGFLWLRCDIGSRYATKRFRTFRNLTSYKDIIPYDKEILGHTPAIHRLSGKANYFIKSSIYNVFPLSHFQNDRAINSRAMPDITQLAHTSTDHTPWELHNSPVRYFQTYPRNFEKLMFSHIQSNLGLDIARSYKENYKTNEEILEDGGSKVNWKIKLLDDPEIPSQADTHLRTYEKLTHNYNSAYLPMFFGLESNDNLNNPMQGSGFKNHNIYNYLNAWCVENEFDFFGALVDIGEGPFSTPSSGGRHGFGEIFSGIESNMFNRTSLYRNTWSYREKRKQFFPATHIKLKNQAYESYRANTFMLADTNRFIKYMGNAIHYTYGAGPTTDRYRLNNYRNIKPAYRDNKNYEWTPATLPEQDHLKVWSDVANDVFPIRYEWYNVQNGALDHSATQLMDRNYAGYGVFHYTNIGRTLDYTYPNFKYLNVSIDNTMLTCKPAHRVEDDGSRNDKFYHLDRRAYLYHYFKDNTYKQHINNRSMDLGPMINLNEYGFHKGPDTINATFNYTNLEFTTSGNFRFSNFSDITFFRNGMTYTKWNGAIDLLSFSIYNYGSLFRHIGINAMGDADYNTNASSPALRATGKNLDGIPLNMFGIFTGDIATTNNANVVLGTVPQFTDWASGNNNITPEFADDPNTPIPDAYSQGNFEVKDPYLFVKNANELFKYDLSKFAFDQTNTLAPYLDNSNNSNVTTFINNLKSLKYPDGSNFNAKELYNKRTTFYPFNSFAFFTPTILDENTFVNNAIGINNTGRFGGYLNNPIQEFNSPINNGIEYRLGFNRTFRSGLGLSLLAEKGGVDGPYGIGESDLTTYTENYSGWGNNAPVVPQKTRINQMPILVKTAGIIEDWNMYFYKELADTTKPSLMNYAEIEHRVWERDELVSLSTGRPFKQNFLFQTTDKNIGFAPITLPKKLSQNEDEKELYENKIKLIGDENDPIAEVKTLREPEGHFKVETTTARDFTSSNLNIITPDALGSNEYTTTNNLYSTILPNDIANMFGANISANTLLGNSYTNTGYSVFSNQNGLDKFKHPYTNTRHVFNKEAFCGVSVFQYDGKRTNGGLNNTSSNGGYNGLLEDTIKHNSCLIDQTLRKFGILNLTRYGKDPTDYMPDFEVNKDYTIVEEYGRCRKYMSRITNMYEDEEFLSSNQQPTSTPAPTTIPLD